MLSSKYMKLSENQYYVQIDDCLKYERLPLQQI